MKPYFLILLVLFHTLIAEEGFRKISVTGESQITLKADYTIIHSEIKTVKKEMPESYRGLQVTLSQVLDNLKEFGLSDEDITLSIIRQGSEFTWRNNSREHIGFFSSCQVQFRINDLEQLPWIYDELSRHPSLTIQGTTYGRNDEQDLRNQELLKALQIAQDKAELMAESLGVKLGEVVSIQEIYSSGSPPRVEAMYQRASPESPGGTVGSVTLGATLLVEFLME